MMGRKRRRTTRHDEPRPEGDDLVEWGGELMLAAGFTSGGAPYGETVDEFREANAVDDRKKGWARAKEAFWSAAVKLLGTDAESEVGWVKRVGQGLYRDVFLAEVRGFSKAGELSRDLVALIPRHDAPADLFERVQREPILLDELHSLNLGFRVPQFSTVVLESQRPVLVREFLRGMPLDLRAGRQPQARPWKVVGRTAAEIHSIDPGSVAGLVPGFATRKEHAVASIEELDAMAGKPVTDDALTFMRANLPKDEPASFLHGDLLGQNILIDPEQPQRAFAVIDWEHSLVGDPAYDLAIVTRGVRRPFQMADGLDRVLGAYHEEGGAPLTKTNVHLHELCLIGGYYLASLQGDHPDPADQVLQHMRGLLRRAEADVSRS